MSSDRVAIEGTLRAAPSDPPIGAPDPAERIEVTVFVRGRERRERAGAGAGASSGAGAASGAGSITRSGSGAIADAPAPRQRRVVSREEFLAAHGADTADLEQVVAFARRHGLDVLEISPARRSVVLAGAVADFTGAFGAEVRVYAAGDRAYRARTGVLTVPEPLARIVTAVTGFDVWQVERP